MNSLAVLGSEFVVPVTKILNLVSKGNAGLEM